MVQALRLTQVDNEAEVIVLGNLRVAPAALLASIDGRPLGLTSQEFELLALLARRSNRFVSQQEIALALWQNASSVHSRRLGVVMAHLRRKLAGMHPYRIETVRMRGYGLTAGQY